MPGLSGGCLHDGSYLADAGHAPVHVTRYTLRYINKSSPENLQRKQGIIYRRNSHPRDPGDKSERLRRCSRWEKPSSRTSVEMKGGVSLSATGSSKARYCGRVLLAYIFLVENCAFLELRVGFICWKFYGEINFSYTERKKHVNLPRFTTNLNVLG